MIQNVAVIANPKAAGLKEALIYLSKCLASYDVTVMFEEAAAAVLSVEGLSHQELAEKADVIVVLGGDGTMLLAANVGYKREIPIIGFHMGRIGFITPFYQGEIEQVLKGVFTGDMPVQDRMRLTTVLKRDGEVVYKGTALNEVTLMKGGLAKMTYFDLFVGQTLIKNYRADGFIVSTSTGSTGYSLSAGGPIVEPWLELFVLTPICSHSMDARDLILSADSVVNIVLSEEQNDIYISRDGVIAAKMEYGDTLEIRKSRYKTKLYHSTDRTFFDHLKVKFGWSL